MTDDATRENYEKYGNPDGPQAATHGIALPAWLADKANQKYILAAYFGMLLCVVITVAWWWNRSKDYERDSVLIATMRIFVQQFYPLTGDPTKNQLIEYLSLADEYEVNNVANPCDRYLLQILKKIKVRHPSSLCSFLHKHVVLCSYAVEQVP